LSFIQRERNEKCIRVSRELRGSVRNNWTSDEMKEVASKVQYSTVQCGHEQQTADSRQQTVDPMRRSA
jgi:hypothetical protein